MPIGLTIIYFDFIHKKTSKQPPFPPSLSLCHTHTHTPSHGALHGREMEAIKEREQELQCKQQISWWLRQQWVVFEEIHDHEGERREHHWYHFCFRGSVVLGSVRPFSEAATGPVLHRAPVRHHACLLERLFLIISHGRRQVRYTFCLCFPSPFLFRVYKACSFFSSFIPLLSSSFPWRVFHAKCNGSSEENVKEILGYFKRCKFGQIKRWSVGLQFFFSLFQTDGYYRFPLFLFLKCHFL